MADANPAAVEALEDEIASIENRQGPTREKIAALQAELADDDAIVTRNRAAISLLKGEMPLLPSGRAAYRTRASRAATTSTGSTADVSRDRVVDFLGANGESTALSIGEGIGISGPPLTKALKAMVEDGALTKTGEKRGTKYALKVGG